MEQANQSPPEPTHKASACGCGDPLPLTGHAEGCVPAIQAGHCDFTLYFEGDDLYEAMLKEIAAARSSICLESYIFASDEIGWRFAHALAERVAAGVEVRLHLDAAGFLLWGSGKLKIWLRDQGIQLRLFHRWRWRDPLRYNQRNHRKLLVIDDNSVFLGGFNIHRESSRLVFGDASWRDAHVRLDGKVAQQAGILFDDFWNGKRRQPPYQAHAVNILIPNFSRRCRQTFKCLYTDSFRRAQQSIYLTTPYFVPDRRTQLELQLAAKRGVDVRLLVPRKNDQRLAQWAARAAYAKLLDEGVRIFEYLPRMLHAKTAVVDGSWATIGTANLDYRSLFVNYEINLATRDPSLCEQLAGQFMADLEDSEEISKRQWATRPWSEHLAELIGWLARRWL